jgi:DNA adenine methylase
MASAALKLHEQKIRAKPFLKWAGGKGAILESIFDCFPQRFKSYHEPFVGGGAVFFGLQPKKAVLSDINAELINVYKTISDDVDGLIRQLRRYKVSEDDFYKVRARDPKRLSVVGSAARTVFLNRTCFNGLYRVNKKGKFNAPYGRYTNPKVCNEENLRACSEALQDVEIIHQNALEVTQRVSKGDLVYFDPPYDPVSSTASFTSYTAQGFGREEQEALAEVFASLVRRKVNVVLSNSNTPFIQKLYKGFKIKEVFVRRAINSRADRRGPVSEVLVYA